MTSKPVPHALSLGLLGIAMLAAPSVTPAEPGLAQEPTYLSPTALAMSPDGRRLYVACATAGQISVFDTGARAVVDTIEVAGSPLGLVLTPDGATLYVTCGQPQSVVCVVNTARNEVIANIPTGHTTQAPVLSPDGGTLYVCSRFDHEVAFIDLASRNVTVRVAVPREPVGLAVTRDGRFLLAANHLQAGRADDDVVASSVSVIDVAARRVCREIALPNGSTLLRDIRVSPDGRHAVVVHQLSRFHMPTTQLERGWVNTSAASILDVEHQRLINTVLLDNIDAGAANPWGVAWGADGQTLCVTHAGTHELSVIRLPALLDKLHRLATADPSLKLDETSASRTPADVPNDLSFLVGLRERVRLGAQERGPRAVVLTGTQAWVASYFSDTLTFLDLSGPSPATETIPLGCPPEMTQVRRGEMLFNDATLCFQGWQSCSSCHSHDARVDSLNWDNLNDGIGNPKNAKSLLLSHATPPSMWLRVRANAGVAVRAGIKNSLCTVQPPEVPEAIDAYLKSLQPIPSPRLLGGRLSPAARRGQQWFHDEKVRCADCHKGPYLTDLKAHDVGTLGKFDNPTNRFDTPSLVEVWRSGPYLHDGRARSVREVVTEFNREDRHGVTSHLTPDQIADLVEYVLSQ
jgi:YVTN family beta-propeller protein